MGFFLVSMLGCLAAFGTIFILVYRFIQNDTYEYDMQFVWDRYPATLEQMEFKRGK